MIRRLYIGVHMYMVIILHMEIKVHIINSCLKYYMYTLEGEFDLSDLNVCEHSMSKILVDQEHIFDKSQATLQIFTFIYIP